MKRSNKLCLVSILSVIILSTFTACNNSKNISATETIQSQESVVSVVESESKAETTVNIETSPSKESMPKPFSDDCIEQNAGFYQPCNRILDDIPVELINLRDSDEVADWISSFPSESITDSAPSSITEYKNIYSFAMHFEITKDEAKSALKYYLNSDDEQIRITQEQLDIIFSEDVEKITRTFASKYSVVVGECIYCPNWIYTHSIEEYTNAGITAEAITAKIKLYSDFNYTNEARTAFSNKLSDYTGTIVNLNELLLEDKNKVSDTTVPVEDTLIIEDNSEDIVEEPLNTEAVTVTAQNVEYPALERLSEDAEKSLKEDFLTYSSEKWTGVTASDMFIYYYYGTYNGCEAVVMYNRNSAMNDSEKIISVAEYQLILPSGSLEILLHKDGTFINVNEAYDNGVITASDVKMMKYYEETKQANQQFTNSIPKNEHEELKPLATERVKQICEDYAEFLSDENKTLNEEDVFVFDYYGTYNDGEVVVMNRYDIPTANEEKEITIAGYTMILSSTDFNIYLHRNSTFIDINSAYETGHLNESDIEAIAYYVNLG